MAHAMVSIMVLLIVLVKEHLVSDLKDGADDSSTNGSRERASDSFEDGSDNRISDSSNDGSALR